MDDLCEDFQLYWETNMFFQTEELESWGFDDPAFSGSYDSSSPDGVGDTSAASNSKNIVSERNRRKKLNERLFALRAAVPTISKMDKASIVKDAINYIQVLQAEERSVQSDITELERRRLSRVSTTTSTHTSMDFQQEEQGLLLPPSTLTRAKKKKTMMLSCSDMRCRSYCSRGSHCGSLPGIEDIELRFSFVGDNMVAVNLTCSKVAGAMVKLCEIFESLKHKIVTTHISAFGGKLFKTVVVEANGDEIELLKISLETAIANLNNPQNQMSF